MPRLRAGTEHLLHADALSFDELGSSASLGPVSSLDLSQSLRSDLASPLLLNDSIYCRFWPKKGASSPAYLPSPAHPLTQPLLTVALWPITFIPEKEKRKTSGTARNITI